MRPSFRSPGISTASTLLLLLLLLPGVSLAANPVQWSIVEEVHRTDTTKTWNSPTPIDLNKMVWEYDYEITKVTGTVNLGVFGDVTQDITSSIPEEDRIGSGETTNVPAILVDDMLAEPESGTSAHIFIEIDNMGFGRAEFSDIMLGSVNVPLFGSRPIQRINVEAMINVVGYDYGDFTRDGHIDAADYVAWRETDGTAPGYESWRSNFGETSSLTSSAAALGIAASVPEPSAFLLAACAAGCFIRRREIA